MEHLNKRLKEMLLDIDCGTIELVSGQTIEYVVFHMSVWSYFRAIRAVKTTEEAPIEAVRSSLLHNFQFLNTI